MVDGAVEVVRYKVNWRVVYHLLYHLRWFASLTCPVVTDFALHHRILCTFRHSVYQPSVVIPFLLQYTSSATLYHQTFTNVTPYTDRSFVSV